MVVQLLWAEGDNLLRKFGLQRANLGAFERYGEVLSGAFISTRRRGLLALAGAVALARRCRNQEFRTTRKRLKIGDF